MSIKVLGNVFWDECKSIEIVYHATTHRLSTRLLCFLIIIRESRTEELEDADHEN